MFSDKFAVTAAPSRSVASDMRRRLAQVACPRVASLVTYRFTDENPTTTWWTAAQEVVHGVQGRGMPDDERGRYK